MARMMPAYCPDQAPPGERAVYDALASGPETDGWIALHSLGIADHVRQVQGEADFVVIVPDHGVCIVEVKSHRTIDRMADGRWKLGSQSPTGRSPFQQANEAMHSLREYLISQGITLRSIPLCSVVWFTHVRARTMLPTTPEWHDWQVLDSEDLRTAPAKALLRALTSETRLLEEKINNFAYGGVGPDDAAALWIAGVLRPKFEMASVPGDLRRARETQLATFIDEQFAALDAMQDNAAVLFIGPAGSGKTMLALEAARRETAVGRSGRVICFNRLLGRRLRDDTREIKGVVTATFHQALLQIAGIQPPPGATQAFWDEELPDRAMEALLDGGESLMSDFLVVDEIQDIAREPFLDVLDLMVKGGLSGGRVLLFGDFERQTIFETGDGRDFLRTRIPRLTSFALTTNCRNLPRIGYLVNTFSKLEPGYRRFRRQDDGVDPTFVPYAAGTNQTAQLLEAVGSLRKEGFGLHEIVVLSPLRAGSTAETTEDLWLRQVLHPHDGGAARHGQLRYSTIHAFKGLEAPAIVVTDLDRRATPYFKSLLYVGLTRATDRLFAVIETGTFRSALGGKL